MSKIVDEEIRDVEAVVLRPACLTQRSSVKKVWIPSAYQEDGDRDAGIATLYVLGDTVRQGIARDWTLIAWCVPCPEQRS